ncbi:NHLP leader peptide family natural product precursor [Paenibacillus sp. FSL A5-0031]|uniref:NHLP leader peptide family RiPP precursor n=1 Tax=Paenibacillus sp. FSL A5-0031 TaxID=1920420 RepID=UPI00096DF796|nr:NHLP leader peptide family RiPP precursor [Paenibacillus sp. FSL A5-0031]OME68763.1 NHLP leader peptide family natural product precursor [Paenibacillus sp. FSL A5-0031]
MSKEQSLRDQIIQKAWEDPEFKKQLIANPKEAVKEAFGIEIPDTIEVEVVEESENKVSLVIPQNPKDVKSEEQVAVPMWE